jgi:ribosome-associated protein
VTEPRSSTPPHPGDGHAAALDVEDAAVPRDQVGTPVAGDAESGDVDGLQGGHGSDRDADEEPGDADLDLDHEADDDLADDDAELTLDDSEDAPEEDVRPLEDDGGELDRRAGLPVRAPGQAPTIDARAALEHARRVVDLAADKKASDIVLLDVTQLTSVTDYFVICSGNSERQLGAIADGILDGMRQAGVRPIGREGVAGAHWLLIDFGSVIVHVFAPPERDFYQLERRWSDAPTLIHIQ